MTDKRLHKLEKQQVKQQLLEATEDNSLQKKRRKLLKGTVAIPVIMTLHSGAALARTSNVVGPVTEPTEALAIPDSLGQPQIVCVRGGEHLGDKYDLGDNPVTAVAQLEPNTDPNGNFIELAQQGTNCNEANLIDPGGIMISATAWNSIAPKVGGITM